MRSVLAKVLFEEYAAEVGLDMKAGLPSVSRDDATGRDAIKVGVHQLVDSLKRASKMGKTHLEPP